MTKPDPIVSAFDMTPVCRCLCRRARIFRGSFGGLHHMPDEFVDVLLSQDAQDAMMLGLSLSTRYCFWWSTFEVLRGVVYRVRRLAAKFYFVPRERRLHAAEFKYDCYYCGKKTKQPPHPSERGGHYPSCCFDCIEKWGAIEGDLP